MTQAILSDILKKKQIQHHYDIDIMGNNIIITHHAIKTVAMKATKADLENTITPPVTMGYLIDAGRALKNRKISDTNKFEY